MRASLQLPRCSLTLLRAQHKCQDHAEQAASGHNMQVVSRKGTWLQMRCTRLASTAQLPMPSTTRARKSWMELSQPCTRFLHMPSKGAVHMLIMLSSMHVTTACPPHHTKSVAVFTSAWPDVIPSLHLKLPGMLADALREQGAHEMNCMAVVLNSWSQVVEMRSKMGRARSPLKATSPLRPPV